MNRNEILCCIRRFISSSGHMKMATQCIPAHGAATVLREPDSTFTSCLNAVGSGTRTRTPSQLKHKEQERETFAG
ncbi:hypothetical protein LDENG_00220450 [Lucifuga dentata]|nr:hypothetical protein LDENG_00220450 [Lucifuga dentata]